jgi:tetratricopeptide (TPR) repeat protein
VTGLIQRLLKKYGDSARSFQEALKFEPTNIQILRDASNLYLHSREFHLHEDMRRKFLITKSSVLSNYSGFALGCHLTGNLPEAIEALKSLLELAKTDKGFAPIDHTNVLIYYAQLLKDADRRPELVELVRQNDKVILNSLFKSETLALGLIAQKKHAEALAEVEKLLRLRPDNKEYIDMYVQCQPSLTREESLEQLTVKHPNRLTTFQLLLLTDDTAKFRRLFGEQLVDNCRRFIPSFFNSFRSVCRNETKREIVKEVLENSLAEFRKSQKAFGDLGTQGEGVPEDPTVELFLLFTLARFYYETGEHATALARVREAIQHTPTFEDAYALESKVLIKLGRYKESAEGAMTWHKMAFGDKGLNSQAVKVLLKVNENVKADTLFKRFFKEDLVAEKAIHEFQMLHYETALASSYSRELKWTHAMALLSICEKSVDEFFEDQYDFYSFCLRKFTLLPLYEVLRFNDFTFKTSKVYLRVFYKAYKAVAMLESYRATEKAQREQWLKEGREKEGAELEEKVAGELRSNTVDCPQEIREAIDLSGAKQAQHMDFGKRRDELAHKLRYVTDSPVKDSLKAKVHKVLFWHSLYTQDYLKMKEHFFKLCELNLPSQFLEVFRSQLTLNLKKQLGNEDLETVSRVAVGRVGDGPLEALVRTVVDSVQRQESLVERSNRVTQMLEGMLRQKTTPLDFKEKKALLQFVKDYCFDFQTVIELVRQKTQH